MTPLDPVTLTGRHVTLALLSQDHAAGLRAAVGGLHQLWYTAVPTAEGMTAEIDRRLSLHARGTMLPFAVLLPDGTPVGMTTYMNIDTAGPRVEIGSTWYSTRVQRSGLNTEAKRMLLAHAFDRLGCLAVEFRTHRFNSQSRRAIERLGAQLDGMLRAHMRSPDGTLRDTAVYSITASEWPTVRSHLDWQLAKPRD
ncbi:MAG: GNAT family N-acetyltransferase [Rhodobacterales bacterium]|nr:GNAT family N-acetyltransferase [Rhodobacterales bacterium]NCT11454.1 GNAT family N-acetyltransferase [Rhodobacterales bacterium]